MQGETNLHPLPFTQPKLHHRSLVIKVIGNPPLGSTAVDTTPAAKWCAEHECPIPDRQIAMDLNGNSSDECQIKGRIILPVSPEFAQTVIGAYTTAVTVKLYNLALQERLLEIEQPPASVETANREAQVADALTI